MSTTGRTLNISPKYLRFFLECYGKERYQCLCGGRRSGKTFSTLQWLAFLSQDKTPIKVMIAAPSASLLQATIEDAQDCLGIIVTGNKQYGDSYIWPSGTVWQFANYDDYAKTIGKKCDILFLNEASNLDEKSFRTLIQGVRKFIILNYNPLKHFWVDDFTNGHNLMNTTWQDNKYLTDSQKEEFISIKEKADRPDASVFDKYMYEVFYCGHFSDVGGKVFKKLYTCTDEEYSNLAEQEYFGLDFGFSDGADNTVLMGTKVRDNCLYVKRYLNSKQLADNKKTCLGTLRCRNHLL